METTYFFTETACFNDKYIRRIYVFNVIGGEFSQLEELEKRRQFPKNMVCCFP